MPCTTREAPPLSTTFGGRKSLAVGASDLLSCCAAQVREGAAVFQGRRQAEGWDQGGASGICFLQAEEEVAAQPIVLQMAAGNAF